MAQYTVSLSPSVAAASPGGVCTLVVHRSDGKYVKMLISNGQTIVTDDPETIAALDGLSVTTAATKCVDKLGVKPPSPTYEPDKLPPSTDPTTPKGSGGGTNVSSGGSK